MTDPDNKIIPFGKHSGKPVEEVLATDPQYLQWLCSQPWFRERYVVLHQTIINRGAEPEETPEHNALQVLFLDDEFCAAFIDVVRPKWRDQNELAKGSELIAEAKRSLIEGIEELKSSAARRIKSIQEDEGELEKPECPRWMRDRILRERDGILRDRAEIINLEKVIEALPAVLTFKLGLNRTFEHHGIDVVLTYGIETVETLPYLTRHYKKIEFSTKIALNSTKINIEIKPTIGDDYPAVLRQMKRTMAGSYGSGLTSNPTLFLGTYIGAGATEEQFIRTFATAGIRVVFKREVLSNVEDSVS